MSKVFHYIPEMGLPINLSKGDTLTVTLKDGNVYESCSFIRYSIIERPRIQQGLYVKYEGKYITLAEDDVASIAESKNK